MEFELRHVVRPDQGWPVVADVEVLVVKRGAALRSIAGEELRSLLNADGARLA